VRETSLPQHDAIGPAQRAFELGCIATAACLLLWQAARIALAAPQLGWWHLSGHASCVRSASIT
jgi:hypothetical protein